VLLHGFKLLSISLCLYILLKIHIQLLIATFQIRDIQKQPRQSRLSWLSIVSVVVTCEAKLKCLTERVTWSLLCETFTTLLLSWQLQLGEWCYGTRHAATAVDLCWLLVCGLSCSILLLNFFFGDSWMMFEQEIRWHYCHNIMDFWYTVYVKEHE